MRILEQSVCVYIYSPKSSLKYFNSINTYYALLFITGIWEYVRRYCH